MKVIIIIIIIIIIIKTQHDKMLCPVYHAFPEKYGFNESDYPSPWYVHSHPQPSKENNKAKILWDIPWQLEKCPKNGANKPDISMLDMKNKEWSLVEGTICTPGTIIAERTKNKCNEYVDRLGIKNLYPGCKFKLISP